MNPSANADVVLELKARLASLYGERLAGAILFGSQARGDATEDSDIDVLIVLKEPFDLREERRRTLAVIAELSLKHNALISDIIVSADEYRQSDAPLYREVRREGLRL